MEIRQKNSVSSGYQSRPAAPPSAGRALSVLLAVCAVLWVWLMLPRWWQIDAASYQVKRLTFNDFVFWSLVVVLNIVLLLYATRPMWRGERQTVLKGAKRGFVLLLCLLFHLLTPPCTFLLVLVVTTD